MKTKLLITFLLLNTLLVSCNFKKAPECSDEKVTQLVKKIIADKIRSQLKDEGTRHFNLTALNEEITAVLKKKLTQEGIYYPYSTYPFTLSDELFIEERNITSLRPDPIFLIKRKQWEDSLSIIQDKYIARKKILRPIVSDSIVDELKLSFSVEAIRIKKKEDEIQKCSCEAVLYSVKDKIESITYSAQVTEDGNIYVTVYDLN
jgi:hypothetical protein